jgi:hypothetical protein
VLSLPNLRVRPSTSKFLTMSSETSGFARYQYHTSSSQVKILSVVYHHGIASRVIWLSRAGVGLEDIVKTLLWNIGMVYFSWASSLLFQVRYVETLPRCYSTGPFPASSFLSFVSHPHNPYEKGHKNKRYCYSPIHPEPCTHHILPIRGIPTKHVHRE